MQGGGARFHRTNELDERGYFLLTKHALVTFSLNGFVADVDGVTNTRLDFFNHQNMLNSARVERIAAGYLLTLEGSFGVDGSISCESMSVDLEPCGSDGVVHAGS